MDKRMIGWAIALGLCAGGASAGEWTRTIDLTASETRTSTLDSDIAATRDAFWIGNTRALDPVSGQMLSPNAVDERKRLDSVRWDKLQLVSSRRGKLWTLDSPGYMHQFYAPDRAGTFWGVSGVLFADLRVALLAADGAQSRSWNATELGHAGLCVISARPFVDADGALVLLGRCDGSGADGHVLRLDGHGQISTQSSAPVCARDVYDDRHGGYYARCDAGVGSPPALTRISDDTNASWHQSLALGEFYVDRVFADGAVLLREAASDRQTRWKVIDGGGQVRFEITTTRLAVSENTIWSWSHLDGRLLRHAANGNVIATAALSFKPNQLVAHDGGSLLLRKGDDTADNSDDALLLYSGQAQLLRSLPRHEVSASLKSQLAFNDGEPLLPAADGRSAVLIDTAGAPASAPFSIAHNGRGEFHRARANASTVCTEFIEVDLFPTSRYRCFDRTSGADLGLNERDGGTSTALHLGSDTLLAVFRGYANFFGVAGGSNRIVLSSEGSSLDSHPQAGLATLEPAVQFARLFRYRLDGSIAFARDIEPLGQAQVLLTADGSVLVADATTHRLDHYSANGELIGQTVIDDLLSTYELLDAESSSAGVQLLLQERGNALLRRGLWVALTPQLVRRAQRGLPYAQMSDQSFYGNPPRYSAHAMWTAADGSPYITSLTPAGLLVQRLDTVTAEAISRRVLPLADPAQLAESYERPYAVDRNGNASVFEYDPVLARNVLRISSPTASAFNGPIRQTALSGSWYSPNSTGQGLIVDLLNGGAQLFAAWHTYAPEGGNLLAKQQWLSVQGQVGAARGAISLPIYRNSGGRFDVVGMTDAVAVGTADLVFTSCDRMEFWYRIGDEVGALPLQRLTPRTLPCDNGVSVEAAVDAAPSIDLTGPWFDPSRSGQGLAVSASGTQFNQFFAGWFTYDADNADDPDAQHWFSVQGANPARYGDPVTARIYRTVGGSRSGEPTRNTHVVGSAQLTVHDCSHATLEYVFDDSVVAGAFANQTRSVPLTRLGQCTD